MKKIILLFFLLTISIEKSFAQFYDSGEVYCYVYDESNNDRSLSKNQKKYYVFYFEDDLMSYSSYSDYWFRAKLLKDPDFFEKDQKRLWKTLRNKWNSSGSGRVSMGPARDNAYIYEYYSDYSSYDEYTYRIKCKDAIPTQGMFGGGSCWSRPTWGGKCFTFSSDRDTMIKWNSRNPNKKEYYKRVDIEDLTPSDEMIY